MRQIILDTETTGIEIEAGHRLIEIGCIELVNRKFTGKKYHQYINPQREIDAGAFEVHGLSNDFLYDKPVFGDIAADFIAFVQGAELIIHNAPFDVGFLNYELRLTQQSWNALGEYCNIVDTLVMARQLHMGQRNSLDALCKRYKVDNSQRDYHGALLDAHLLAQVYLAMTGGQGSFFEESQPQHSAQNEQKNGVVLTNRIWDLPIVLANAEEVALHEAKLQGMSDKGKCVWLVDELVQA